MLANSDNLNTYSNCLTCVVFGGFVSDNLLPLRELLLFNSDDFFDDKLSFSSNLSKNGKLIVLNWHIIDD